MTIERKPILNHFESKVFLEQIINCKNIEERIELVKTLTKIPIYSNRFISLCNVFEAIHSYTTTEKSLNLDIVLNHLTEYAVSSFVDFFRTDLDENFERNLEKMFFSMKRSERLTIDIFNLIKEKKEDIYMVFFVNFEDIEEIHTQINNFLLGNLIKDINEFDITLSNESIQNIILNEYKRQLLNEDKDLIFSTHIIEKHNIEK